MKALTKATIIIMLASSVPAAAVFAQAPSAPAASVGIQTREEVGVEPLVPSTPIEENIGESRSVSVSVWPSERSTAGAVLVIPSTEMKPEDIAAVMEDMSIMSRIFDRNLGQQRLTATRTGVFFDRDTDPWSEVFVGRSSATQAIYLEGFGSLFLIGVDFPLSAPPKVQEDKSEEGVDTVWKETKKEIYNPGDSRRRVKVQPQKEYDAEKIQELQKTIIKTLKHTANIRGLKSDEWVTVVVRSSSPAVIITSKFVTTSTSGASPAAANVRTSTAALPAETAPGQATFLTIRAKKSDVDSFAKNQLDYDKFSQRVSVLTY